MRYKNAQCLINGVLFELKFYFKIMCAEQNEFADDAHTMRQVRAECTGGMVETDCFCLRTCMNYDIKDCDIDSADCVDGCHCPDGQAEYRGMCVEQSQCPCTYLGVYYEVGESVMQDCRNW